MLCDAQTHKHACLIKHESRSFVQLWEPHNQWRGCCFANTDLSFIQFTYVQDVLCMFSNNVVFAVIVKYVYLSVAFTEQCVPVETSCTLYYLVVILLFFCVCTCWNCCHVTLLRGRFFTSWLSFNSRSHLRDIRRAGELSLPSTAASKENFSVHTSLTWGQITDFPFLMFVFLNNKLLRL